MNRIFHMERSQFTSEDRKIKRHTLRKLIGKPKHRGDITDRSSPFFGWLQEDKQNAWCLN